jgi:hypothetical protein
MEPISKAEFSIVTRASSSAWIPELIAAAGPEVGLSPGEIFPHAEETLRLWDVVLPARSTRRRHETEF